MALDIGKYIIDEPYRQHGNGYDQLDGDYAVFYKVASRFIHKVKFEDRGDLLHDLFLAFARVKASYQVKGKLLTTGGLVRIAQYEVADYWRKWYHRNQNSNCGRCSKRHNGKSVKSIGYMPDAQRLSS